MGEYISLCVRAYFERFIDRLGYENHFTIYDTDDQKTLIKGSLSESRCGYESV